MAIPETLLTQAVNYALTKEFQPFRRSRVLVVEDNPADALMIEEVLTECKRRFTIARNAEAAEALIKRNGYSLAFVDLRLPGMSGQHLINLIRDHSPHTHIVVVCGLLEDAAAIHEEAVFSVIRKPVTVEKMRELLGKVRG